MANVDGPNGFTPAYHQSGGTMRSKEYRIATSEASSMFSGGFVKLLPGGTVAASASSDASVGVFMGCLYTAANGDPTHSPYWPGGTATLAGAPITAYVIDDPQVVFRGQFDGTAGVAGIGALYDITVGTGDTTTGRSRSEAASAAPGTGPLRLLDFIGANDNDPALANAEGYFMLAEHQLAPSAVGGSI